MFKLMRYTLIMFGSALLLSTILMLWSRHADGPVMILSSNFRDNDQSLYFMTAQGKPLQQVSHTAGSEQIISTSDDGEWVIVRSQVDRHLYSIHSITGQHYQLWDGQQVSFEGWTLDRQWVILNATDNGTPQPTAQLYRVRPDGDGQQAITSKTSAVKILNWSPNGEWLYFAAVPLGNSISTINRVHVDGSQEATLLQLRNFPRFFEWTKDGEWAYFAAQSLDYTGIRLYRMSAIGQDIAVLTQSADFSPAPLWSADGEWLYYSARRQNRTHIYRLSTVTGQEHQLTTGTYSERLIGWSQDHERLFFRNDIYPSNSFGVYQMAGDGRQQELLYRQPFMPSNLVYQQNGRGKSMLVFSGSRQYLNFTVALSEQAPRSGNVTVSGESRFVGLSADGDWLIFHDTSGHTGIRDIYRVHTSTGERQTLVSDMLRYRVEAFGQIADNIRLSPDDEWIYYELAEGRGVVALIRMRTDGRFQQVVHRVEQNNGGEPILVGWLPSSERALGFRILMVVGISCILGVFLMRRKINGQDRTPIHTHQATVQYLRRTARINLGA